jgi:hypothetical protein
MLNSHGYMTFYDTKHLDDCYWDGQQLSEAGVKAFTSHMRTLSTGWDWGRDALGLHEKLWMFFDEGFEES